MVANASDCTEDKAIIAIILVWLLSASCATRKGPLKIDQDFMSRACHYQLNLQALMIWCQKRTAIDIESCTHKQ